MSLKILRTRQPPDEHLRQMVEMLRAEGLTVDRVDVLRRLPELPKEDRFLLAVDEDLVVGFAHARVAHDLLYEASAVISTVLVRRDRRRRGVASRLLSAAEAWAREAGRSRLLLRAEVGQRDLHAFCVARGYEQRSTSLHFVRQLDSDRKSEAETSPL
jgi:GNAT superfamily N-acetyltransferase